MTRTLPLGGLLRSEWTKLATVRSTWWCAAVYAAVVLALTWLGAAVTDRAPDAGIAVAAALTAFGVGQLVVVVLGVLAGAGEFTTGMAVASFGVAPRRARVLLAKTAVVAGAVGLVTAVLALASLLAARALTEVPGGIALADPAVLRPLALQTVSAALVAVVAVALGTLLRSTAGGVGTGIVLVLVLPAVLEADGRRVSDVVADALPALRVGEDAFLAGAGGWAAGLAAAAAWAAATWALAAAVLVRRDV
jgi:ABC-2 type transport system permease protein